MEISISRAISSRVIISLHYCFIISAAVFSFSEVHLEEPAKYETRVQYSGKKNINNETTTLSH